MVVDNFIKMGPNYINWSSNITSSEIELVKMLGTGSARKIAKYKVIVKDLLDMLLFRCHGYRKVVEQSVELDTLEEPVTLNLDNYEVSLQDNYYTVKFSLAELKRLVRINRSTSKWDSIKDMPRCVMDIDTLVQVLDKIVRVSILTFSPKACNPTKLIGSGVVITNAFIDETDEQVYITLDKAKVDVLTPDNQYNAKYLADSFVLGSEYCKNFHSFISYFADVFASQKWSNKLPYNFTSIASVAEAMGTRFDPKLRDYDKETSCYARTHIVQFVKNYTKELNEKTRIPSIYGKLNYEIIRDTAKRGKVKGFRFYFEED